MTYAIGGWQDWFGTGGRFPENLLTLEKICIRNEEAAGEAAGRVGDLYARALISYGVNVVTLVLAFLVRNFLPFSEIAFLIGTAAGLVVMNKVLVFGQKKQGDGRREEL